MTRFFFWESRKKERKNEREREHYGPILGSLALIIESPLSNEFLMMLKMCSLSVCECVFRKRKM